MAILELDPASAATLSKLRDLTNRLEKQEARSKDKDRELDSLRQVTLHGWFFDHAPDLLAIVSIVTGHFLRVSPSFTDVLGWSEEELLRIPRIEFVHPDDLKTTLIAYEQLAKGGKYSWTSRYRKTDGTYVSIAWRAVLSATEPGLVYAVGRPAEEM